MFEEFKDNFKSSDLFQLLFFELNKGNHLVSLIIKLSRFIKSNICKNLSKYVHIGLFISQVVKVFVRIHYEDSKSSRDKRK